MTIDLVLDLQDQIQDQGKESRNGYHLKIMSDAYQNGLKRRLISLCSFTQS